VIVIQSYVLTPYNSYQQLNQHQRRHHSFRSTAVSVSIQTTQPDPGRYRYLVAQFNVADHPKLSVAE